LKVIPEGACPLGVLELLACQINLAARPIGLLLGQLHMLNKIGCRLHVAPRA
jgi:hypothetical protein